MSRKLTLRSKIQREFTIEVDDKVIGSCDALQKLPAHIIDNGEIKVDMTKDQLEKFVELHNHFPTATSPKDLEWTNNFFRQMPEKEFKELCWNADVFDSQRFLEAACDFVLNQMVDFDVSQIRSYFNIVDDYTARERRAMEANPFEFFTGVSSQNDDNTSSTSDESSQQ